MNDSDLYARALDTWGAEPQWRQLQEECAELIAEINRLFRGRADPATVASELVDVEIMLAQARVIFARTGHEDLIDTAKAEKLARLQQRIEEAAEMHKDTKG